MSKDDRYRRKMDLCLAKAAKSPFHELRSVWETIAGSYAFLAELESRPELGPGQLGPGNDENNNVDDEGSAMGSPVFNGRRAGDRTLPG